MLKLPFIFSTVVFIAGCAGPQARLNAAAEAGNIADVRALLEAGARINVLDKNPIVRDAGEDVSPLMAASVSGRADVVKLLLDKGAAVDARSPHGGTALAFASWQCHDDVVKLLAEKGADIEAKNAWGRTPLSLAAMTCGEDLVRYLLEKGADVKFKSVEGSTPLDYAASYGNAKIARLLLDHGADPLETNNNHRTPAETADFTQHKDVAAVIRAAMRPRGAEVKTPSPGPSAPEPTAATLPQVPELAPNFASADRPNDLAVIIGVESYSGIDAKALYAERDAALFRTYVRALGVPERNIVLLTGPKAVRSALTKNVESWLPRMVKPDSRVYFYFSGHGAPDIKSGQAYLVSWDGDPNFLDTTAYPVALLYKKLGELPAAKVLVALDSCFSGSGGRSVLASGARPLVTLKETSGIPAKLTILAASAVSEISGSLDDKGHGAFTYFLLQGLNAGHRTPKQLVEYATPLVQDEARRLNRDQTPQLRGDGDWSLR